NSTANSTVLPYTAGVTYPAEALSRASMAAAGASGDRVAQLVCESLVRLVELSARADVAAGEEQAALEHARAGAEEAEREGRLGEAARLWYLTSVWEGTTLLRCATARAAAERTLELGGRVGSSWLRTFGSVAGLMFLLRGRG